MTQHPTLRTATALWRLGCLMLLATLLAINPVVMAASDGDTNVRIAAASSLREVLPELIEAFSTAQGTTSRIDVSYSSSGNLSRQIQQGAPFDLFLSANKAMVQRLPVAADRPVRAYALGQLSLITREDTAKAAGLANQDFASAMELIDRKTAADDSVMTIALASPQHAPYGIAAVEVLSFHHWRSRLEAKWRQAENAAQVLQIVQAGGASVGLVPKSLLQTDLSRTLSLWHQDINPNTHKPIEHTMMLVSQTNQTAEQLFDYLSGESSAAIWQNYGFNTP